MAVERSEALAIGVAPADGALVLRRSEEEIAVGIKLETREGTLVTGEQDGALRVGEGGWGGGTRVSEVIARDCRRQAAGATAPSYTPY